MTLHKATFKDIPAIFSLILAATRRGKILKRTRNDVRKTIHHFWVAKKETQVIACVALEIYSKKLAEVRSLVVDEKHEGQGIASELLDHCLREAKNKKIYEVLVITDRENLFKRKGFLEQLHGQKALFLRP